MVEKFGFKLPNNKLTEGLGNFKYKAVKIIRVISA